MWRTWRRLPVGHLARSTLCAPWRPRCREPVPMARHFSQDSTAMATDFFEWDELSRAADDALRPERMFEGSRDFLRGWEVLWAIHQSIAAKGSGEQTPISACAMCASMALELALKSLITLEQKEPVASHSFARLFRQVSGRLREEVASQVRFDGASTSVNAVTSCLKSCEGTLDKWRYRHEHRDIDFNQGHMMSVTLALHEVVSRRLVEWRKRSHPIQTQRASFTEERARALVARALERLHHEESDLADDVNERTWSHRFAVHLEREVRRMDVRLLPEGITRGNLSVDCEYNRRGDDPKRLHELAARVKAEADGLDSVADMDALTVYPDVIVHRRGKLGPNLIAIEVKRANARREAIEWDMEKLTTYKSELGYIHAFLVVFGRRRPRIVAARASPMP
ncbi:hypothetical protein PSR1_00583 [Anaeromyxobacter sp. PSR-1]|nr:hypothetical protein PSR1_00583 [Anaeromyxobacter sp. PSR-1]